jgi:hypothetical protein
LPFSIPFLVIESIYDSSCPVYDNPIVTPIKSAAGFPCGEMLREKVRITAKISEIN